MWKRTWEPPPCSSTHTHSERGGGKWKLKSHVGVRKAIMTDNSRARLGEKGGLRKLQYNVYKEQEDAKFHCVWHHPQSRERERGESYVYSIRAWGICSPLLLPPPPPLRGGFARYWALAQPRRDPTHRTFSLSPRGCGERRGWICPLSLSLSFSEKERESEREEKRAVARE